MTTTIRKTDSITNRAPKGGMVSLVNGLFYKGGQFMPMASADKVYSLARPVRLEGSVRQVLWATRLRDQAITRLEEQLIAFRLDLASPKPFDAKATRQAILRDELARHRLMTERSAASVIERRAAMA
jgi:hypothetical protein